VEEGKIEIGAAMYDVTTSQVEFYDDTVIVKEVGEMVTMN
jgi:hypothetical protein